MGATSAIAIATSRQLAARKASFYLVARSEPNLEVVASDLRTRGAAGVSLKRIDLDDTTKHVQLLESALNALGYIDLALIAHGIFGDQEKAQADYSAAEAILRTNLLSPISLCTWLGNYFEAQRRGVLAVISSVAGDRGRKSNYIYGTTKGALNIFLDGLRNRIDRHGVHVLTIRPGFVATPMTAHLHRGRFFADPNAIGRGIVKAIECRKDVVYLPAVWAPIMLVVRNIPRSLFKRLDI